MPKTTEYTANAKWAIQNTNSTATRTKTLKTNPVTWNSTVHCDSGITTAGGMTSLVTICLTDISPPPTSLEVQEHNFFFQSALNGRRHRNV